LNKLQERDVHDRQSELRGVTARIDQLREELRGIHLSNQHMTERSVDLDLYSVSYLPLTLCSPGGFTDDEIEDIDLSQPTFPGFVPFEYPEDSF
jgi:hypothetical protein